MSAKQGPIVTSTSERRQRPRVDVLPALCAVLDHLPHAVILLSSESRLLFHNRCAQRLLAVPGAVSVRRGRLWIADELAASLATQERTARVLHGRPAAEHRLYVTRLGLRRKVDPIALLIFTPPGGRKVSVPLLQQLYRLTHAEAATAAQLFAGQRPAQVARSLSVSTNTVRAHLKRIFAKCQVNSQAELVRLVALGPGVT